MPERDVLLDDLRQRVEEAFEQQDATGLLTPAAERAAAALASIVVPVADPEAAHVLGMHHWARHDQLPPERMQEELVTAVRFLAPVHDVAPDAVPEPLLVVFGTETDGELSASEALEAGLLACLAYEHDRHPPLLERAIALFRVAVAGTFEDPRDRAMSLNNLGYALRLAYERDPGSGTLDEAVTFASRAVTADEHPEHAMFLSNLAPALLHLYWRDRDREVLDAAVEAGREAVAATPSGHPNLLIYRNNLALALHTWAEAAEDAAGAAEAIELTRSVLTGLPTGHPARLAQLHILAMALRKAYEQRLLPAADGDALLSEALSVARTALAETRPGHPTAAERARNLAVLLHMSFQLSGDLGLLREAVDAARAAVDAVPAYAGGRAEHLHNLGLALRQLAEHSPDVTVADEAVTFARAAVAAPGGDVERAQYLNGLGAALTTYYGHTGRVATVTEAVAVFRSALDALPAHHVNRPGTLGNLSYALRLLFEAVGDGEALAEAVTVGREAVETQVAGHPDRVDALNNLATALARAYEGSGRPEDAEEAVACGREAVAATPEGHPGRPARLNNLGMVFQTLSHRGDSQELLEEGAGVLREALAVLPVGHPMRPTVLNNLANTLLGLFQYTGDRVPLREAAERARAAVDLTPAGHPHRGLNLNSLGLVLQQLSWATGDSALLPEAVAVGREAVAAAPEGHPHRSLYLANLGTGLQMVFQRLGRAEDIAEAVDVGRRAVDALPEGHPHRVLHLLGLANTLLVQVLHTEHGQEPPLAEAMAVAREAVAATPEGHLSRARVLSNLSAVLRLLFRSVEDPALLHEAVVAARAATAASPPGHSAHANLLNNLASALYELYELTGERSLLEEVLTVSRTAAGDESAATAARVTALRTLAVLAPRDGSGAQEALAAAEQSVALLPQIGLGDLDLSDRGHLLGETGSVASVAAAAALDAGRPGRAVELLEQSRGVLTAEFFTDTEAESERLRASAPELAEAFDAVRRRREALDRPSLSGRSPLGVLAEARREAQVEWNRLLERIRSLDGFAGFLAPPGADRLTEQAAEGPVVYVSAAPTRCDALVLTGDSEDPVHVVPLLGGLTASEALRRILTLGSAIDTAGDPDADPVARRSAQGAILDLLAWLWDTVTEPVLTALGHTGPPAPGASWPRVWWCPVGILAYLPLHAAGHHEDLADGSPHRDAPRTVLDRAVSSYTATVRGLGRARARRDRRGPATTGTVIVAVPDAPGAQPLDGAATEAALLKQLMPDATLMPRPTRDSVLTALPDHPVAHFACHSEPHSMDPWRGRLILHDHATDPLTVADIGALRLSGGLAFLSACYTTISVPRLADEALHITGAFQLAGYPHVVGTQWPVPDRPAHRLATDFYGRLTDDGTAPPDPARSAEALHHATRRLRARFHRTPALWAAHTHTGV